jgi:uncharacterized membrane protein YvbJ
VEKRPKFFCESCGREVRQSAKFCPHCGKFFSSVKCPSCGLAGDQARFSKGCPVCGYAFTGKNDPKIGKDRSRDSGGDPLPAWMYVAALAVVVALIALILIRR